uniref:hypothetical protein n=1 Tax=Agathobacter sp. TaxID=2021311 RepID=UPI00405747E9
MERKIHSLAFLWELPNLKVLELGGMHLESMDGTEWFLELEELCIWPDFYYQE